MNPDKSSLYRKYVVSKASGHPVDPNADYFVLRLDTDPAARAAAYCYAREVQEQFPALAEELIDRLERYDFGDDSMQPSPVNALGIRTQFDRLRRILNLIDEKAREDQYSAVSIGVLQAVATAHRELFVLEKLIQGGDRS